MQGSFVATKNCPAVQSIRKGTNPGNASVKAGQSYKLLGKNKDEASHYWVELPGASPVQRWVAVDCGAVNGNVASGGGDTNPPEPATPTQASNGKAPFYILAISWQPAFCEGLSGKPECQSQTEDRYDARHFTLHGLWPQPRDNVFCGVSDDVVNASEGRRWEDLPAVSLSTVTKAALDKVMPGTQSYLERHEWTKHGTCYGAGDQETYYRDSVRLMDEINGSMAQGFVAANIGRTITGSDFRAAFDQTFGAGAGDRIRIACKDDGQRRLIVEMTLGLKGDIAAGTPLKDLLAASSPTDPGCTAGIIDPVGLQ